MRGAAISVCASCCIAARLEGLMGPDERQLRAGGKVMRCAVCVDHLPS
jgi:hypothetical protein